jgi:hypothetical protein
MRLRQEDCKYEAGLGYIVRPCLKKQNKNKPDILKKPRIYSLFIIQRV